MLDKMYQDLILQNISKKIIKQNIAIFLKHKLGPVSKQYSLTSSWPSKKQN